MCVFFCCLVRFSVEITALMHTRCEAVWGQPTVSQRHPAQIYAKATNAQMPWKQDLFKYIYMHTLWWCFFHFFIVNLQKRDNISIWSKLCGAQASLNSWNSFLWLFMSFWAVVTPSCLAVDGKAIIKKDKTVFAFISGDWVFSVFVKMR